MTIEILKNSVLVITKEYPIKKITLFGSRAAGTNKEDSDVDLIIEFSMPVSLLTLSMIKLSREPIEVMNQVNTVVAVSRIPDMEELEDAPPEAKTNIQHTPFN